MPGDDTPLSPFGTLSDDLSKRGLSGSAFPLKSIQVEIESRPLSSNPEMALRCIPAPPFPQEYMLVAHRDDVVAMAREILCQIDPTPEREMMAGLTRIEGGSTSL